MSLIKTKKPATGHAADANEMSYIKGKITAMKSGEAKSDPKFADYVKTAWKSARTKPEYKALSNTPEYKELDKLTGLDSAAEDAAEFKIGQKVKAKPEAASWTGYQGHALGNRVYTVKKVDADGAVILSEFLDVFVSAKNLVAADSASGQDSKADFMDSIMPIIRKLANVQKKVEDIIGEVEDLKYEAGNGGFPDSPFAKKSADKLETACHEALSALRRVKAIPVY